MSPTEARALRGIQPSTPARKFSEVSHRLILLEAPGEWRFVRGLCFFLAFIIDRGRQGRKGIVPCHNIRFTFPAHNAVVSIPWASASTLIMDLIKRSSL